MVVQARAAQGAVVEIKAQWLDQRETRARVGTQPDDVTGVRRNLRFEQDYVHGPAPHEGRSGATGQRVVRILLEFFKESLLEVHDGY